MKQTTYSVLFQQNQQTLDWELTGYMPDFPVDLTSPHSKTSTASKIQQQERKIVGTPVNTKPKPKYKVEHLMGTLNKGPFTTNYADLLRRVVRTGQKPKGKIPPDNEIWHVINLAHAMEVIVEILEADDANLEAAMKERLDKPEEFIILIENIKARQLQKENKK